jgi:apoptosis-inducing factor 2
VHKNLDAVLNGKSPSAVKTVPFDILLCSTGRSRGVGRLGPVKIFSFMVHMIKGKTLGRERLQGYVNGSAF